MTFHFMTTINWCGCFPTRGLRTVCKFLRNNAELSLLVANLTSLPEHRQVKAGLRGEIEEDTEVIKLTVKAGFNEASRGGPIRRDWGQGRENLGGRDQLDERLPTFIVIRVQGIRGKE